MANPHRFVIVSTLLPATFGAAPATAGDSFLQFTDRTDELGLTGRHEAAPGFVLGPILLSPMLGGAVVGDFNNDGWPDIFVVAGGGEPDRLMINDGDGAGTFTDQAADWGVALSHKGLGAAVGDYDGDGWQDVFICSLGTPGSPPSPGHHILYRNTGKGSFVDVAAKAGVLGQMTDGLGATFGDYDLDGDLDLCIACWAGAGSRLYRNEGDGTFVDVSVAAGVYDATVRAFSPTFIDMNGDRYPELLLASDYGTSRYFVNQGDGTFVDATVPSGTGLDGNGMGHAVGDFNRDGRLDWYVTSIRADIPIPPWIPGDGNMLYLGSGPDTYDEQSIPMGVNDGGWGWGTVAVDLDHDGYEDIVETNGWPFANAAGQYEWTDEPSYVFMNQDGAGFVERGMETGLVHTLQGRGLLTLDVDGDGDLDLLFVAYDDDMKLFRNELTGSNHWLKVRLDSSENPLLAPRGRGAFIRVTTAGGTQIRVPTGGSTYLSQSDLVAHFGLGEDDVVETLRVDWPDGTATELHDLAVDQLVEVASGNGADVNDDGRVDVMDFIQVLVDWGLAGSPADVDLDGVVGTSDLVIVLSAWSDR